MRGKSFSAPHEFLIGIKTFNGENLREGDVQSVIVHAFVITADKFDDAKAYLEQNEPIESREVTLEMTVEEFAHRFKCFHYCSLFAEFELDGTRLCHERVDAK